MGNEFSFRIKLLCLTRGVEDSKVGLRVGPSTSGPLPAPVIGRQVSVEKFFHKVAFPPLPGDKEIFGKKGGDDHPEAIMHPAGLIELSHGGIHDGVPGLSFTPRLKPIFAVLPLDLVIGGAECARDNVRKLPEDLFIKISPNELSDKHIDLFFCFGIVDTSPPGGR